MLPKRIQIDHAYDYRPGEGKHSECPAIRVCAKEIRRAGKQGRESLVWAQFEDGHAEWVQSYRIYRTWTAHMMQIDSFSTGEAHWQLFREQGGSPTDAERMRWGMPWSNYLTKEDLPGYEGEPLLCQNISEAWMLKLLWRHGIEFLYEPTGFKDPDADAHFFRPDLYLPEYDLYVEMTTGKPKKKRPKINKLLTLHPEINLKVIYWHDFIRLARRQDDCERVIELLQNDLAEILVCS